MADLNNQMPDFRNSWEASELMKGFIRRLEDFEVCDRIAMAGEFIDLLNKWKDTWEDEEDRQLEIDDDDDF